MGNYNLTLEAEQDINDIIRYTVTTWDKRQANKYVATLENRFKELSEDEFLSRYVAGDIYSSYCEHHYIFFIKDNPVRIIAILHEKMNLTAHLKKRLSPNS